MQALDDQKDNSIYTWASLGICGIHMIHGVYNTKQKCIDC